MGFSSFLGLWKFGVMGSQSKSPKGGSVFIGNVNRCECPKQYGKTVETGGNDGLAA